jgi:2-dehydro-3-deoxyphosphogluconate aldolase / (4S)-4-hydroxy-2-oxoglutarate aldolase
MSDAVLHTIKEARAMAILRAHDRETGREALRAAVRGGFRVLEVTMNTPGALDLVRDFASDSSLLVGAGTILTADQARSAAKAGARFLVSPVTDPEMIAECGRLGCVAIPGAHTPTELYQAHRAGAPLQKLFPMPSGGPDWLRSVLAPMPFLRVIPTNGINADNAADWLVAGAFAVGCVRALFPPDDMATQAFDKIEENARTLLAAVLD